MMRVVFVDDDADVLQGMRRTLRDMRNEWSMEFVQSGASFSSDNSQLEAVQLLMALNRRVYFECPEVPTLGARLRNLMHRASN